MKHQFTTDEPWGRFELHFSSKFYLDGVFAQYGVNQVIEDRMDELMGHPTSCPHGDPIPTQAGVMPELNDKPLTVIPPGQRGTITRVKTREPEKLQYLAEIGLVPGASFELVNRAPFNGPLRLKLGRNEQVIGNELAAALWVQVAGQAKVTGRPPSRPNTKNGAD